MLIYKILENTEWDAAKAANAFHGSALDLQDGFIHFSTGAQVRETAKKYFSNRPHLLLLAVEVSALGDALKWERSRGGALFPHLYGPLQPSSVSWALPLDLGEGGHVFPAELLER
jgi:uncharacterized protein (DUF952 family)